jgi:hypothetical protein
MIIYHGSNVIVEQPQIFQGERMLDFGIGFYTTSNTDKSLAYCKYADYINIGEASHGKR